MANIDLNQKSEIKVINFFIDAAILKLTHKSPDSVSEFDRLIDHVLALQGPLGHCEGVVLCHLC